MANNLTFEAKAKDFRVFPRGRPRRLHFCYLVPNRVQRTFFKQIFQQNNDQSLTFNIEFHSLV